MHQSHKQSPANTVKVQSRGPVIETKITLPIPPPHGLIGFVRTEILIEYINTWNYFEILSVQLIESFHYEMLPSVL